MKRFLVFVLNLLLIVSLFTPLSTSTSFAAESTSPDMDVLINEAYSPEVSYEMKDILPLRKYISVKDKTFSFDYNQAKNDGFDEDLLTGQKKYLAFLNSEIIAGNLEIVNKQTLELNNIGNTAEPLESEIAACNGKTTKVSNHWWGYQRYMNSCLTNEVAADFNSVATISGGISLVAAYWGALPAIPPGLAASYFWLMGSRLSANNSHNTGVHTKVTWALVFTINPQ